MCVTYVTHCTPNHPRKEGGKAEGALPSQGFFRIIKEFFVTL